MRVRYDRSNLVIVLQLPRRWLGFFFQAEDGIRDYKVTGVQTCALPIFEQTAEQERGRGIGHEIRQDRYAAPLQLRLRLGRHRIVGRLDQELAADVRLVVHSDRVADGRRDDDVHPLL